MREAAPTDPSPSHRLLTWLEGIVRQIRSATNRPRVRLMLLLCAAALFLAGAWLSFHGLAISPTQLRSGPLLMLALLTLPSLLYGGIGLVLLARSGKLSIPIGRATVIGADAFLAELMPLPGGAIVRTSALVSAGGGIRHSSALVILTAVLWIALGMIGAGLSLMAFDWRLALPLAAAGALITLVIVAWLWRTAGLALAVMTLVHRACGIALIALRLTFAFAALQVTAHFSQTLPFVLAGLVGSASSLAPAGLGVGESLAALAALATPFKPETAFLAVGLDRIICLAACAIVAIAARLARRLMGTA